ncbi:MAG: hypothetical protein HYW14_03835 [Planctomycetes bacterium]|nr:hypothetical protein [Planctomycetota bacterium]
MKKPTVIAIDIVTFLAMFGISAIVSIVMKGRLGLGLNALTNQRLTNVCIICTIAIIVIAVNKFFIKYTIPVNSPINLSVGFAVVTVIASAVGAALAIGITISGAICLWVCVASDEEIVNKQLFVIDSVIMYTLVFSTLYFVPLYIGS